MVLHLCIPGLGPVALHVPCLAPVALHISCLAPVALVAGFRTNLQTNCVTYAMHACHIYIGWSAVPQAALSDLHCLRLAHS